jgi:hypothetical protein
MVFIGPAKRGPLITLLPFCYNPELRQREYDCIMPFYIADPALHLPFVNQRTAQEAGTN